MAATLLAPEPAGTEQTETATAPEPVTAPARRQSRAKNKKPPRPTPQAKPTPPPVSGATTGTRSSPQRLRRMPGKPFTTATPSPATSPATEPSTRAPTPSSTDEPTPESLPATFSEIARRANEGDEACLASLRRILDTRPQVWTKLGDVGALAERAWAERVAEGNALLEESVLRSARAFKARLAGPNPSPLETAVIDLIGVTWLAVQQCERAAAGQSDSEGTQQAMIRAQRAECAGRRFNNAVRTLALVRRLLPLDVVPLGAKESAEPAKHME